MSMTDQKELKRIWQKANALEDAKKHLEVEALRIQYWTKYRTLKTKYINN